MRRRKVLRTEKEKHPCRTRICRRTRSSSSAAAGPEPSSRKIPMSWRRCSIRISTASARFGFVINKEQYLGARRSGDLKHEAFAPEDVRVYGDAAIAVGSQYQTSTFHGR